MSKEISDDASIAFLRPSTIERLSVQLNPEKLLLTDNKHLRDWRGVYEYSCINDRHVFDQIKYSSDPFKHLLDHWKHFENATVQNLFLFLSEMDRFDVIDDNKERIAEDIKFADKLLRQKGFSVGMIENEIAGSEKVLTYDDIACLKRGKSLARYDVLILHAAEDSEFTQLMVQELENQKISVCLRDRDLVVGTVELQAITKLISERCSKVAVILSPNFFSSAENAFYSSLAQTDAIQTNQRSFLPIIYKPVKLPSSIDSLTKLRVHGNPYFWTKLCRNIKEDWSENRNHPLPPPIQDTITTSQSQPNSSNPITSSNSPAAISSTPASTSSYSPAVSTATPSTQSPAVKSGFRNNLKTNFLPSTPKLKTGGGFLNKMLKPVRNLVSGGRERPAVTEFSNVLFSEQSEGSIVRLIDSAPDVPVNEPGKIEGGAKLKNRRKSKHEAYQQIA